MARSLRTQLGLIALVLAIALFCGIALCSAGITLPGFSRKKDDTQDPFEARNLAHPPVSRPTRIASHVGPPTSTGQPVSFPGRPSPPFSEVARREVIEHRPANDRFDRERSATYEESRYDRDRDRRSPTGNYPSTGVVRRMPLPKRAEYQPSVSSQRNTEIDTGLRRQPPRYTGGRSNDRRDPPRNSYGQEHLGELITSLQKVATVGNEPIFFSELAGPVNQQLKAGIQSGKLKPEQIDAAREMLVRQGLDNLIEQRIVFEHARGEIPPEAFPRIEAQVNEQFDKVQLKRMMAKAKVKTHAELDALLRKSGSSIKSQRKFYFQRSLTTQWMHKEIDYNPEVTHEEMLRYFHQHRSDHTTKAAAQWEELYVRFDKFDSKEEAYNEIARMGNDVWRGRTTFAEVAKRRSDGISALQGGRRNWANRGSLASQTLDHALFSQAIGELGPIIEDEQGFYIVRVVERKPQQTTPFVTAQVKIRESIRKEKVDRNIKEYLAKIREKTPVWTIFDARRPTDQSPRR